MDQDKFNKLQNLLVLIYENQDVPHTDFLLKISDEAKELVGSLFSTFLAAETRVLDEAQAEDYLDYVSGIQRILSTEQMFQWLLQENRTLWTKNKMDQISNELAQINFFGLEDMSDQNYGPDGFDTFRTNSIRKKELKAREILRSHRMRIVPSETRSPEVQNNG
jgi:hypothetical protein